MSDKPKFYICPMCFKASETQDTCHVLMIACDADNIEDCRPVKNKHGHYHSRAPLWFVKGVSQLNLEDYVGKKHDQ